MKKNYLLFIVLTVITTIFAFNSYRNTFYMFKTGRDLGYYADFYIEAKTEDQQEVVDIIFELFKKHKVSISTTKYKDEKLTIYLMINDEEYARGLVLESGDHVKDLDSKSFYYSNTTEDLSKKIYLPVDYSRQLEYVPLSVDVFNDNSAQFLVSSRDKRLNDKLSTIEDEIAEKYSDKIQLVGRSGASESETLMSMEEPIINQYVLPILVLLIASMLMIHTTIKNSRKISIQKLEGQSTFIIFFKNIFKHVIATYLIVFIIALSMSFAFIPIGVITSGNAGFFINRLVTILGSALIGYTLVSFLVYYYQTKVSSGYILGISPIKTRLPELLQVLKIVIIVFFAGIVVSGLNSSKSAMNALISYPGKVKSLHNVVYFSYAPVNTTDQSDGHYSIVKEFIDGYDTFWFDKQKRITSIQQGSEIIVNEKINLKVNDEYLKYHDLHDLYQPKKLLILYPKGTTPSEIDKFRESIDYLRFASEEDVVEVILEKDLIDYSFSSNDTNKFINLPIVYSGISEAEVGSNTMILKTSFEQFEKEYQAFNERTNYKYEDSLEFTNAAKLYKSSIIASLKEHSTDSIYWIILAIGVVLLNILVIMTNLYKNKVVSTNSLLSKYAITQLIVISISLGILLYVFKNSVDNIGVVALYYITLEMVSIGISYIIIKRGGYNEARS